MIGIVIVSHSEKLAQGVLELAAQMTHGAVPMEAAGGIDAPDNPIGTDPMRVLAAIESVAAKADAGVLVVMDLGSALMSAEAALDFLPDAIRERVRLCSAPLVEGTVAAAARAAAGGSLRQVEEEAAGAIQAKIRQLAPISREEEAPPAQEPLSLPGQPQRLTVRINNRLGLHARPAANLVTTAGKFHAVIEVQKGDARASAASLNQIALLSVKNGDTITFLVSGDDAPEAIAALSALHADNFGEQDAMPVAGEPASREAPLPDNGDPRLQGLPASPGYAVGPAFVHDARHVAPTRREIADPDAEIKKLDQAIATALGAVETLRLETEKTSGKEHAAIFAAHALLLKDKELRESAVSRIATDHSDAAFAWHQAVTAMAGAYRRLDDAYLQARAADVADCGQRVLRILTGETQSGITLARASILVAQELSPSEVAGLDPSLVLGIVTETGGATAHAAILARAMGIPAATGVAACVEQVSAGQPVALDGFTGTVWTAPGQQTREALAERRTQWLAGRETARAKAGATARTADGMAIAVMANIGSPEDAARALAYGAEGVGLFRTEFLFHDRAQAPDEEEQFEAYVAATKALQGKPVVIRTVDIGGDKPLAYLDLPKEANPFLGERGIRLCLSHPALLRTQLRALWRAATVAPLSVMYPMVSDVQELVAALRLQAMIRAELVEEGRTVVDRMRTGIMVEVPAAAASAATLAPHCDFFSIGTNDLTQYVMAADRGNAAVGRLCDSLHPAVLRMIAMTCDAAQKTGKTVSVCGELAANSRAVPLLLGLGVGALSMNGPAIAEVKEAVRAVRQDACRDLAAKALEAASADAVRALLP